MENENTRDTIDPEDNKVKIPTTFEECFAALDALLNKETKSKIISMSQDDFTGSAHFGLGLWIRNNWIHTDLSKRIRKLFFRPNFKEGDWRRFAFVSPDYMSGEILRKYYDYLTQGLKSDDIK